MIMSLQVLLSSTTDHNVTPSACGSLRSVSICIPVGRSPRFVGAILSQLATQAFPGPVFLAWYSEDLGRELGTLAKDFRARGLDVDTVRGPGSYAPNLRNIAVQEVRTPWCLFLDDDVVLGESYLETLRAILEHCAEPIVVQGAAFLAANHSSWLARCEARLSRARLEAYREGETIRLCDARNLLIPTAIVRRIGFDEELGLGSEGHVLTWHLIAERTRILYVEELFVSHYHRSSPAALARQKFNHGRGRVHANRRLPEAGFKRSFRSLWDLFWRHGLGPLRYWWASRISLDLLPYAIATAAMFCAGMLWEISRISWSTRTGHRGTKLPPADANPTEASR